MKKIIALLIMILGVSASAQIFTPQAPSGSFMEVSTKKVYAMSVRGNTDTIVYTYKTPVYGVWKNDTAIAIVGLHKASQDSITYLVNYRVIDPQGQYLSSSWTTAVSANLNLASLYYYKYTPGTAWIEVQVKWYYNGPTTYTKTGTSTLYTIDFKSH